MHYLPTSNSRSKNVKKDKARGWKDDRFISYGQKWLERLAQWVYPVLSDFFFILAPHRKLLNVPIEKRQWPAVSSRYLTRLKLRGSQR